MSLVNKVPLGDPKSEHCGIVEKRKSCWLLVACLVPLGVTIARSDVNHSIWTPALHSKHPRTLCQTCHHENQLPPGQRFALMPYRQCHTVANRVSVCPQTMAIRSVGRRHAGLVGPSLGRVPSFLLSVHGMSKGQKKSGIFIQGTNAFIAKCRTPHHPAWVEVKQV